MKKTFLILVAILMFGCSEDDTSTSEQDDTSTSEQQETFTISTESNSVIPFRYVIVSTDVTLNQQTYSGSFGGQEIELIKSAENELIFVVPDVSQGPHSLEITIDNKNGILVFQVSNNQVQDIAETINTELIVPLNELNQNIDDLLLNYPLSLEVRNSLISSNKMLDDFITKFSTLSEEERIEVAKFYNANPLFTNDYLNLSNRMINGNSDYDCFNVNSNRVILTTLTVLTFVAALPHLSAVGPLGSITALTGFIAGVYAAQAIISTAQELLINECFLPFEHALNDNLGNSNNFEVFNDEFQNFTITSTNRHIISNDVSNPNTAVSFTLAKLNVVHEKWEALKNGINSILSNISNWFNNWFSSSSSKYDLITYEFENIPNNSEEIIFDGDSEFITIADFPSDVNVLVNVASDNSINLKLTADESTLPRTVTGKVKYNDGDFNTENEISMLLQVTDSTEIYRQSAIGNYTVTNFQGNGPDTVLTCQLNDGGQVIYRIYDDPAWTDGTEFYATWSIVFSNSRYYYSEYGFYNGYPGISEPNPLIYPVNSFTYHLGTVYIK